MNEQLKSCPFCGSVAMDAGVRECNYEICCSGCPAFIVEQTRAEAVDAWNRRAQFDREREPDGWISVEERLPGLGTEVLVYAKRRYCEGCDCDVYFYNSEMYQPHWEYVTHWMPLPSPPKED